MSTEQPNDAAPAATTDPHAPRRTVGGNLVTRNRRLGAMVVGCLGLAGFCGWAVHLALRGGGYYWLAAALMWVLCGAALVSLLVCTFGQGWLRAHPERLSGRLLVYRGLWWRRVAFEVPWAELRAVRIVRPGADVGDPTSAAGGGSRRGEEMLVETSSAVFALPWVFSERIDDIADTIRDHMRAHGAGTASPRAGAKKRRRRAAASDEAS